RHTISKRDWSSDVCSSDRGADVVITMFPAGIHVLEAYSTGLLAAARPGTLFIDSSTIAVDDAVQAAKLAKEAGHSSLDAPVSGRSEERRVGKGGRQARQSR